MILTLVLAGICPLATVLWLRRRYLTVTVDGESMLPTYRPGERLLVRRIRATRLRPGQVVVMSGPQWLVKRVAAVPGDPIPRDDVPALRGAPGRTVPAGHLVVLGDNPGRSLDSRQSGYVMADRVRGVVLRELGGSRFGKGVGRAS